MSVHDFALLAAPPSDHFSSSFLQAYHLPHAQLPAFDFHRYHHSHHHPFQYSHPSASYFLPRQPLPPPAPLRGFDPRPPHAGWTPKEEVDEDEQTRELLAPSPASSLTSPVSPHPAYTPVPAPLPTTTVPASVHATQSDATSEGTHSPAAHSPPVASKTYSFVSLPGNAVRKRPRRRYDEIERLYACDWPECTKAYGTLNHLNAHVSMQRHGAKRNPVEFKELRKQWREQKKTDTGSSASSASVSTENDGSSAASAPPAPAPARAPARPRAPAREASQGPGPVRRRRRRLTEPAPQLPAAAAARAVHTRLSLGDLRFPTYTDEGLSPTSSASDSVHYWQDSPATPPLGRLPADSTLLAGYRAASPPGALLHPHPHSPHHVVHSPHHVVHSPHHAGLSLSPHHAGLSLSPHHAGLSPHHVVHSPHHVVHSPHHAGLSPHHAGLSPHHLEQSPHAHLLHLGSPPQLDEYDEYDAQGA